MAINPETLRPFDETNALLNISDGHINQLVGAWVTQWDLLGPEFEASILELALDAKEG